MVGLDGLTASQSALGAFWLGVYLWDIDAQLSALALVLAAAALGFLWFNLPPARIFMGSSGSYFLGFTLAALGIIGGARVAAVMLVLGLPILDVAWLIVQRPRSGRALNQGGRDHLHFRLLDLGISERVIVLSYWGFCAVFGTMTLILDDRIYKLAALIGLAAVGLWVLMWANRSSAKQ